MQSSIKSAMQRLGEEEVRSPTPFLNLGRFASSKNIRSFLDPSFRTPPLFPAGDWRLGVDGLSL
jgi:hypothetical protein